MNLLLPFMLIGWCTCGATQALVEPRSISIEASAPLTYSQKEAVARVCDGSEASAGLRDIEVEYLEHGNTAVVSYVKEAPEALRCYHVLVCCGGFWFKTGSLFFAAGQDPVDSVDYYCGRLVFWDKRMQEIPYGTWPLPQAACKALESDDAALLLPHIKEELYPYLLTRAALQGASTCLEMLLTQDMRTESPAGTALLRAFAATVKGDTATLQQCLAVQGVNVNEPLLDLGSDWGSSYHLLYLAILHRHTDCVRLLLAQPGINLNGGSGLSSPLHLAVSINNPDMVQLLLACKGIDVNTRSSMGYHGCRTPLHNAAAGGKTAIVHLLLAAPGINVSAQDKGGDTALDLAEKYGHAECAQLIRDKQKER